LDKTVKPQKRPDEQLGGLAALIAATVVASTLIYKVLGPIAASISKFIVNKILVVSLVK
jgi:hypothetical protein